MGLAISYVIRAFANCDHVFLAWQPNSRISGCRGFAVYRKADGADLSTETTLDSWLGFEGETYPPGTHKPSTEWPIQKFVWSDFEADPGIAVQYSVAPVLRDDSGQLQVRDDWASPWSEPVSATARVNSVMSAYFNRGVLAAQWIAEQLQAESKAHGEPSMSASLDVVLADPTHPLHRALAGPLGAGLQDLLKATATNGLDAYAALFELNAEELIGALVNLGQHAHLLLANGSPDRAKHETDENAAVRTRLENNGQPLIDLSSRIVNTAEHLAHDKFLVIHDADGQPASVWTGSTNWTSTGLCTQANNALLIDHPAVAAIFQQQWQRLKAAGDAFPPELAPNDLTQDSAQMQATYDTGQGEARITVWFAPTLPGSTNAPLDHYPDLHFVKGLIEGAQQGILFLMFMPGTRDTLLDTIQDVGLHSSNIFVRGALNQDPGALPSHGGTAPPPSPYIALFHRGSWQRTNIDAVLPAAIPHAFANWTDEILKANGAHALVHSKIIVVDPLGAHPVVVTGSHNLGPKASRANDDNLVVVENDSALARAYAVNIMGVYDKYSWRYHQGVPDQALQAGPEVDPLSPTAPTISPPAGTPPGAGTTATGGAGGTGSGSILEHWKGLKDNDTWQNKYFDNGTDVPELQFWLS